MCLMSIRVYGAGELLICESDRIQKRVAESDRVDIEHIIYVYGMVYIVERSITADSEQ